VITSTDSVVRAECDSIQDLLETIGPGWRRLHTTARRVVRPGDRDDRDDRDEIHDGEALIVGPPGVVALTIRSRRGATAWVGARSVTVDRQHTVLLQNARSHAERSARLLSVACGRRVAATPAVVLANLAGFNVQQMPRDVHVTTDRRLRGWLGSLPVELEADEIDEIGTVSQPSFSASFSTSS
jgi:hypothetical protein